MDSSEDNELNTAIRACHAASEKMSSKRSFRLRTLLQMLLNELEKERLLRDGATNGRQDQPNGNH